MIGPGNPLHSGMLKLEFPLNNADEGEGLGHAGIQTYKDSPFPSVARECGQNSADARLDNAPVVMTFDMLDVREMPAIDEFKSAVTACLHKSWQHNNEKDTDFFNQAATTLSADRIKVLRIADYNTTGLTGPCIEGTPFHALLKGSGNTVKVKESAGGSFGIGKNAVFTISDLQTVLYSTIYAHSETGEEKFLAQGKSILISHQGPDGQLRRSTGYWGAANFQPVEDPALVPEWMRRTRRGTSIFAFGVSETEDWQYKMAASLLMNFFCAIHREEMVFKLNNNEISIDRNTMVDLFNNPQIEQGAESNSRMDDFRFARNLHECLTSSEAVNKPCHIDGIGEVSIRILVREGLPKRLWIVRNGMVITDSLENFGDKMLRFAMCKDFAALVEPETDMGSSFIKKLENPSHDSLSAQGIPDPKKKRAAEKAMKKLRDSIREAIREETQVVPEKETDLDELAEFFSDFDKSDRIDDSGSDDNPETATYKPRVSKPPKERTGSTNGSGSRLPITDFRNILKVDNNQKNRRLYFTAPETCIATIKIQAAGIISNDDLEIISASLGEVNDGVLKIALTADQRACVDVSFSEDFDGPIDLTAEKEEADEN